MPPTPAATPRYGFSRIQNTCRRPTLTCPLVSPRASQASRSAHDRRRPSAPSREASLANAGDPLLPSSNSGGSSGVVRPAGALVAGADDAPGANRFGSDAFGGGAPSTSGENHRAFTEWYGRISILPLKTLAVSYGPASVSITISYYFQKCIECCYAFYMFRSPMPRYAGINRRLSSTCLWAR